MVGPGSTKEMQEGLKHGQEGLGSLRAIRVWTWVQSIIANFSSVHYAHGHLQKYGQIQIDIQQLLKVS